MEKIETEGRRQSQRKESKVKKHLHYSSRYLILFVVVIASYYIHSLYIYDYINWSRQMSKKKKTKKKKEYME